MYWLIVLMFIWYLPTYTHTHTHTHTASDEVAQRVQELDNPSPGLGGPGIIRPKGCRNVSVVVRAPNTYYNPIPKRSVCSGSCPHGQTCTPFKTVTRNFKVLVFRRFNCWGLIIWLPIGLRRLCITDEFDCQCKPICKPILCFHLEFSIKLPVTVSALKKSANVPSK